jgi:hypothetical protein
VSTNSYREAVLVFGPGALAPNCEVDFTPKAFANFSLGQRPRKRNTEPSNAESVGEKSAPHPPCERFQRYKRLLTLALERCPRLELANAFGVAGRRRHYSHQPDALIQRFLKFVGLYFESFAITFSTRLRLLSFSISASRLVSTFTKLAFRSSGITRTEFSAYIGSWLVAADLN